MTQATLAPPAARQGPGPIPQALVESIDLMITRLITRTTPSDRRAAGVGAGVELAQMRPYEVGDDVRHIDAAATARTGQPHVRLHVPERALTTWIVLDLSPSMAFGTAERLKADIAEGVTLVLTRIGIRRAGAVGVVAFGAGTPRLLPPRASKPGIVAVRRLLAEGVTPDGQGDPHAFADALVRLGKLARQPGLIALVSDFRDQEGWARPLGALRVHHSVLALEIGDPRERELPALGRLALIDPESGRRIEVDTSRRKVRQRFAELERDRRTAIARELRRLRVDHVVLDTDQPWLLELGRRLR
jgi:uncharacterized protein (DUF58 family)